MLIDRLIQYFWKGQMSWGQEGEDLVLTRWFDIENLKSGFYVDVGANDPRRFSNSYAFYRRGWHGIAVEPDPDLARRFRQVRPRDCVLETAIGEQSGTIPYFRFNEPALNTCDPELARQRDGLRKYRLLETRTIPVQRLEHVFEQHLPVGQVITFMSVDVEGLDLQVLRSNDWKRFRPRFLLVESLTASLANIANCPIHQLLVSCGYSILGRTSCTFFYRDDRIPSLKA